MNNNPLISIIIPVYKTEQYLCKCLDSVLAQTYTDWECICIDDGSPDGCPAILDQYAARDSRFHVIHKPNGGVSSARNAGIDCAKGDWFCFVDSDDYITPDHLQTMISTGIDKDDKQIDMVNCGVMTETSGSSYNPETKIYDYASLGTILPVFLKKVITLYTPWCKLIRRSVILDNNIRFNPKIRLCEDTIFSYTCLAHSRAVEMIPVVSYVYSGEWSNTKYKLTWDELSNMHHELLASRRLLRNAFPGIEEMVRNYPPRFDRIPDLMHHHTLSECFRLWADALEPKERDLSYFLKNVMLPEDYIIPLLCKDTISRSDIELLCHFLDVPPIEVVMPTRYWRFVMTLFWRGDFSLMKLIIKLRKLIK